MPPACSLAHKNGASLDVFGGNRRGHDTTVGIEKVRGNLKPHVGHKVEVTGMMSDDKMMGTGAVASEKMPMTDMHMLTVKSVKMISATGLR